MTKVTPRIGYYAVCTVTPAGLEMHFVGRDKRCTCGSSGKRPCRHIRAVAEYLRDGGERAVPALEPHPLLIVREAEEGSPEAPSDEVPAEECPICGAGLSYRRNGFWRCSQDSTHYWRWRSDQNDGAIRKFLTRPHPVKRGAFYAMTEQEREAFLLKAVRRMHKGGYTPHNGKEHNQ